MNINMCYFYYPQYNCVGLDLPDKKPKMQASDRAVHMHYICQVGTLSFVCVTGNSTRFVCDGFEELEVS